MSSEVALTNQRARIQTHSIDTILLFTTQTLIFTPRSRAAVSSDGKVPSRSLLGCGAGRPVSFPEAQQIGYIMFWANLTMLATYLGSHGFFDL